MYELENAIGMSTESEVYGLYERLKAKGNEIHAFRLRAAFLKYRFLQEELTISPILVILAKQEVISLSRLKDSDLENFSNSEFAGGLEFTRMSPFLMQKLLKENALEPNLNWDFAGTLSTFNDKLYFTKFQKRFNKCMFDLYSGTDFEKRSEALGRLMEFNLYQGDLLRDLGASFFENKNIFKYESVIESEYLVNRLDSFIKEETFEYLRDWLMTLFAYYYYDNDKVGMQLTYLRLLQVMDVNNPAYWTIRFFGHELKLIDSE